MSLRSIGAVCGLCAVLYLSVPAYAVDQTLSVPAPQLEVLSTAGIVDDELFLQGAVELGLELYFQTGIETGVLLRATSDDFVRSSSGTDPNDNSLFTTPGYHLLYLSGVYIGTRGLFRTPLALRYFLGESDRFGNGLEFPQGFERTYFSTEMRGMRYWRESGIPVYDGLEAVRGHGIRLTSGNAWENIELRLYAYHDMLFANAQIADQDNIYSGDLRVLFNSERLSLDSYVGVSYPWGDAGVYRAGTMFFYDNGSIAQFFAQVGLPAWEPFEEPSAEDLYLLFEPRLYLRPIWFALTFFRHPAVYERTATNSEGYSDIQLEAMASSMDRTGLGGGIRNGFRFRPRDDDSDQLSVRLSPFVRSRQAGYSWELALEAQLYPYESLQSFTGVFSFATEL